MKIFNVVLAGLIFLLAVVAAVFSFFLFEKRSQLVTNYEKLGKQVATSAGDLDSGTNTGVAAKVTPEELSHSNSTNLPTVLKNFDNLAKEVIRERDTLAKALFAIARTLENNQFTESDFTDHTKYAAKVKVLSDYVAKCKANHDSALEAIANLAGKYGISTSVDDLKAGQLEDVVKKLNNALARREALIATYQRESSALARKAGVSFNPSAPAGGLQAVSNKYTAITTENGTLKSNVRSLEGRVASLNRTIVSLNREIADLKAQVAERDRKIASLHKNAGVPSTYQPIAPGSRRALDMVRTQKIGKVLVVDEKFGFVTISVGKKTYVVETLKDGPRYIDPRIPVGAEMIVVRPLENGRTEYISRVKITKLDEYCSIAEPNDKTGKAIKVGDMVYFSEKEIDKIVKNRK